MALPLMARTPDLTLTREYLLLSLHDEQRHAALLVLAVDNSDADLRRRLRVRLAASSNDDRTP